MNLDQPFISSLAQAIGLGIAVAILLWLLRRHDFTRRVWLSVLGAVVAAGMISVLRAAGLPTDQLTAKIITAIAILLAANALLQMFNLILWDYLLGRLRHIFVPRLIVDLFNVVVLAGAALIVLDRVFAVDLTAVLVTSTVVSAVIGLSLQDTLGNIISGLALQMDRPFNIGDWVNIANREGEVMQMNWRTIMLRSIDNHRFVIPNANVARNDIVNYSQPTRLQRLHARVGLSYGYPPGEVKDVLKHAVIQVDLVRTEPPPDILISEYGESAIIYDVRYWIDKFSDKQEIHDNVLTRIWYAIRRQGWSVPFPIRDVNLRQIPEDYERRERERRRQEMFAQLRPLTVFAPLSDEQIKQLAHQARAHRYTAGEVLVRQGDRGDSLFVIKSGHARVKVGDEAGRLTVVDQLGPNDFFGEMSLLTGEHRSASVIAATETEVVEVGKSAIARVLDEDRVALEELTRVVEERLRHSAERTAAAAKARPKRRESREANLLERIQGFLGLK